MAENKTWTNLVKNRAFVGQLIADPEGTIIKYRWSIDEAQLAAVVQLADDLFQHASEALANPPEAGFNDCKNGCC